MGFTMKVEVNIDVQKNLSKVQDDSLWKFGANEWWKLITPYTPMETGTTSQSVVIRPHEVEYIAPQAHYLYHGGVRDMPGLKLNLTSNPSLNLSGLSKGDIQRIVAAVEMALQGDFDLLNQNIDTHTTDTQKHISADERALWNDNVEQTKQNQEAISNIEGHIGDIYDMVHVNKDNIEALQTQMGDVETALDNIIEIQNTLIGGDAE